MKSIVNLIFAAIFFFGSLNGEIRKTSDIQEIKQEVTKGTLVFFNIAEVLMDTETSLGTQAWRKDIRSRLTPQLHDELTLFVFENVPPKSPDPSTPALIKEFQSEGITTFAFTSRGRTEWYSSQVPNVDLITEKLLLLIDIDFSQTELNEQLSLLPELFEDYFHSGVIYATNKQDKGELLLQILEATGYRPEKIVFVDDKADSLISLETALTELGIPFVGYAYNKTAQDHANFDLMIANIQLDALISQGIVLSDDEAEQLKNEQYADVDATTYFETVIDKWTSFQTQILRKN